MDHRPIPDRSVAIVHDYFTQQGGAERFVGDLARLFPAATVHTAVVDREKLPLTLRDTRIQTTPLQRVRALGVPLPLLAPLLPTAFGRIDLGGSALVISSTSAFAHHVRPPAGAVHVAYCHAPPHFLWDRAEYFRERGVRGRLLAPALALLKHADVAAAGRVDAFVANSQYSADRIREAYGRQAEVIFPPIETAAFSPSAERSDRFLLVARLRRHKRIDLAIAAARRLGIPLDIIGEGPDGSFLRALASATPGSSPVRFLGRLTDGQVQAAMARCAAMIVPGTEDFGMTMAEVQAAGRPPVAFARGGALEIIRDGETGFLFEEPTVDSLVAAMRRACEIELDLDALVASAGRFDRSRFDREFLDLVTRLVSIR